MKITRMAYGNNLNLTDITVEDYDGSEYIDFEKMCVDGILKAIKGRNEENE